MQVLILDDNWGERELLKMLLIDSEVRLIDEVESVYSALSALKNKNYDFVFVDYYLPDGNGNDFLRLGKSEQKMTKFILNTSDSDKSIQYKEMGFDFALDLGKENNITDVLQANK